MKPLSRLATLSVRWFTMDLPIGLTSVPRFVIEIVPHSRFFISTSLIVHRPASICISGE